MVVGVGGNSQSSTFTVCGFRRLKEIKTKIKVYFCFLNVSGNDVEPSLGMFGRKRGCFELLMYSI